jgi:4-nitrophenyl phosphatase
MANNSKFNSLILDMDGVLWRDTVPIVDLPSLFRKIDERGWSTVFVTNNATRTVKQYVEKLASFGVPAKQDQIINSGLATAIYLKGKYPSGGPVFSIGEEGLFRTLAEFGFDQSENGPMAVIGSLDRALNFNKLTIAANFIRSGVPFIGTNPDPSLPTPNGYIPGTGSILAALEAASGKKPLIIGKPSPTMYNMALQSLQIKPENALVVGDRMTTDIVAGIEAGCMTALVLTGVSDEATLKAFEYKPTYVAQNVAQLVDSLS